VSWVRLLQLLENFLYNTVGVFVRPFWWVLTHKASVVVCFLLRNSPASEFYIPTFPNTVCSVFISTRLRRRNRQSSVTFAHKIQTPGNYPEESKQHSEHGESLKSRKLLFSIHHIIVTFLYCVQNRRQGTLWLTKGSYLGWLQYALSSGSVLL